MGLSENQKSEPRDCEAPPKKRAYRAPELRRLGTVAELTLGATGSVFDDGITPKTQG
jgi:hypothetical protein